MSAREIILCHPVRTAIGAYNGSLKSVPATELGAVVVRETLRRAGIDLPILVLGPVTREQIVVALDNRITIGVIGPEELENVCAIARERDVAIHLKLDSGMGRMGVLESE